MFDDGLISLTESVCGINCDGFFCDVKDHGLFFFFVAVPSLFDFALRPSRRLLCLWEVLVVIHSLYAWVLVDLRGLIVGPLLWELLLCDLYSN